jgi:hypothetical protein
MVASSGKEQRAWITAHSDIQPDQAVIKDLSFPYVGDLQVDMTDIRAGGDAPGVGGQLIAFGE